MISQRTALITGCSDGSLGSALALAFHKAGWRVFASARNPAKLGATQQAGISTLQLDTLSPESIAAAVSRIESLTGGSLDALVNNAAAGYSMPVLDMDIARAQELFNLNVWPLVTVTRAFLPLILKSTHPAGGLLVNHTSTAALVTLPFSGAYAASKAAAASITEALRLELEPFGIRVVALMTGAVKSTFYTNNPGEKLPADSMYAIARDRVEDAMAGRDHDGRAMDADEWAEGVVRDLGRKKPSHWVWGGQSAGLIRVAALLPVGTFDGMVKKMAGLDEVERRMQEGASK